MTSNNIYIKLLPLTYNMLYMNRYIKFINFYINNKHLDNGYTEKHHILPRSLFPELKSAKYNIVKLPYRAHYIAHWLLLKATNTPEMIAAFNGMCNRNKNKHYRQSSIIYSAGKIKFSESQIGKGNGSYKMVSAWNKILNTRVRVTSEEFYSNKSVYGGVTCKEAIQWKIMHEGYVPKVQTDYQKEQARLSSINTAPAKDIITGESLGRIQKDDPRWISGEIISSYKGVKRKTGYKRPNKSK
jgi:hypothetical protein